MPVRSWNSSVFRWPSREEVDREVRRWAERAARTQPGVLKIGYFGSYARGDWGVGSDLDLIVIVARSPQPFPERAAAWDTTDLPVPADVLVYTEEEWERLAGTKFREALEREAVWVFERTAATG